MKKITFLFSLLCFSVSFSQVAIDEDFNSGTPAGWTDTYSNTTTVACEGSSERVNIYGSNTTAYLTTTNQVAASNGTDLDISFDYRILDYGDGFGDPDTPTTAGWGSAELQFSTDDGVTWTTALTINDSNHVVAYDCATMMVTVPAASLPNGSDVKLQIINTWAAGDYYFYVDNFVAMQASVNPPNCDATLTDITYSGDISWTAATGIPTGYTITAGTTSGDNDLADNVDVGNVLTYNLGALTAGNDVFVTIVPYNDNGSATGCVEQSMTVPCSSPTVTYTVVNDCNVSGGFLIDVDITDMGSATSLTVSDDQGSTPQPVIGTGVVQFGPYANATDVVITVGHDQDGLCDTMSGTLTQAVCPPDNDECDSAIALTVNTDYDCGVVTSGTTVGATASSQADDVSGTPNNDVWFSFVATNAEHRVSLENVVDAPDGPTSTDMGIGVYDGTGGCDGLVFTDTSDPNTLNLTGLNIGTTYLVRVYGWASSSAFTAQTTFDVCVGTPPTCYEPTDLDAYFAEPSSAILSWLAPTSGNAPAGYNWEVVPAGNGQGVGVISSGTTAGLTDTATGLTEDTLYDFYVQSDCGGGDLSVWAGPFTFNAGYCIPVGTSTSTYIDNFSTTNAQGMNITNNGSGLSTDNYANNFASMVVSGAPDGTFDFNVEIVSGTVGCAIFIDWNNDYVFDVSEAVYSTTSYDNGPFTGTVTIPNGTPNGDYRMRVMIDWNDSNPGDDAPCSFGAGRGEAEDYKLTVDSTLSTSNFENESAFTYFPNPVKNTLTLNAQNTIENVTMYNMLGQEVLRATPNAVNSELNMSSLQDGAYFVKVTIANITKTIKVIKQ